MKEHKSIGNIQTCLRKMDIYTLMIDKDIVIKLEIKLMFFIALNKGGLSLRKAVTSKFYLGTIIMHQ